MTLRAGIYVRISLDRLGKRAGVQRQLADCRDLAEQEGWRVVDVYEDNDRSAFSGKRRPEYERLLLNVAANEVDVVIAWHSDRLWRSVAEQQAFLVLGRRSSLKLVATPGKRFDPADADDDFVSTIEVAVAQKESADKSRRMTRKQVEKAALGQFHGGGRAYGHDKHRTEIVRDEAKVIREAARRILRGESVRSVTLDLNRRGIPTARGGQWRQDVLADLLQQPRLAGLREYRGQIVGKAAWPKIIDVDTHERLRALFDARKHGPRTRTPSKHLLTGLLRCSKCNGPLSTAWISGGTGREKKLRYTDKAPGTGGCSGTTVVAAYVEETVRDLVLKYLDSKAFRNAVKRLRKAESAADTRVADTLDQLSRDRARLHELGDALADGDLDRVEYKRLTAKVRDRITEGERQVSRLSVNAPALDMDAEALRRAWAKMTLHERRDVIAAVADHFVVRPARPPRNRYDASRIRPVWRF